MQMAETSAATSTIFRCRKRPTRALDERPGRWSSSERRCFYAQGFAAARAAQRRQCARRVAGGDGGRSLAPDAEARGRESRRRCATFRSLPHRLELVGEFEGVQWINDSKATNVSSTAVAIDGMERPTVLLLGGRHKGEAYTGLAEAVQGKVKKVIAYGEAAPIIAKDLRPVVDVVRLGSDFEEVMRRRQGGGAGGRRCAAVTGVLELRHVLEL